jgi:hypothetical protein
MDHGRFVEVFAVTTGWLVVWGDHTRDGQRPEHPRHPDLSDERSVRRRLAWAVVGLTGSSAGARDALTPRRPGGLRSTLPASDASSRRGTDPDSPGRRWPG